MLNLLLALSSSETNTECVSILLEAEPQINCYNATEAACAKGHLPIVKFLVEHQPQIIELASSGVDPCLLQAAIHYSTQGKLDVLSFLLAKGVSPNTHPPGSACPLASVLREGGKTHQLQMITLLLKAGASVNDLFDDPSSLRSHSFQALKSFVTGNPSNDILQLLVDAGLDLSVRDQDTGNTLLHFAAQSAWHEPTDKLTSSAT